MITNGTYAPNTPGATTLRDAKPLWINGHHITAEVYEMDGIQYVSVFYGTEISFGGKLPTEITNVADLYEFIIASASTYANVMHPATDANGITVEDSRKADYVPNKRIIQDGAAYTIVTARDDIDSVRCLHCYSSGVGSASAYTVETYTPANSLTIATFRRTAVCASHAKKIAAKS